MSLPATGGWRRRRTAGFRPALRGRRRRRVEPRFGEEFADDAAHERSLLSAERLKPPHEGEVQHAEEDESVKDVLAGLYVRCIIGRGEQVAAEEAEDEPHKSCRIDDHEQHANDAAQAGDARQFPVHFAGKPFEVDRCVHERKRSATETGCFSSSGISISSSCVWRRHAAMIDEGNISMALL